MWVFSLSPSIKAADCETGLGPLHPSWKGVTLSGMSSGLTTDLIENVPWLAAKVLLINE